jgi:hypothetical protein
VRLPYFDSKTERINESVASVAVEHDAGTVLVYQLQAADKVRKKRFLSQMQLFGRIVNGAVGADSTISYQVLLAKRDMSLAELRFRTRPFIDEYLAALFTSGSASIDTFYAGLDRTVEELVHNGPNEFGDVLLNLQVALPGSILQSWVTPLDEAGIHAARMRMSRALQTRLRALLPLYYFQELDHLIANPVAAALLAWAALPVSTSVDYDFQSKKIRALDTGKDVYWNWPDRDLRKALVSLQLTRQQLVPLLLSARDRLIQAGLTGRAADFDPKHAASFQAMAMSDETGNLVSRLSALCSVEAALVGGAAKAFEEIQQAFTKQKNDPAAAIESLAAAGSTLTAAFNSPLSSLYTGDASRALSSMLLVEATNAISPVALVPKAMLHLAVLREGSPYDVNRYVAGDLPEKSEIALTQSLVNA